MFKFKNLALASVSLLTLSTPALAQDDSAGSGSANDIVVTARRVEERLQDVPISITVFNQQQLANKNVTTATDLANYTPSLSADNNFGPDNTSFAIRGFVQDIGTAPSVGTYFGDVVTPRGATNGQPVGDGASAGDFFDLQNVQVLKGPQGTLQGRNTTGGAVLFVPQKPTDKLEGYVQGGYGNYNMWRLQGVLNVPLSDTFLVRLGVDHMKRDGYLNNVSGIGPKHFGDIDYWAARLSIVANLTPNLENYTIASYSNSKNNGAVQKLIAAEPTQAPFGGFAAGQLARQGSNFYNVALPIANPGIKTEQWQVINTTTWTASDTLTIKNIASYAQLTQRGLNPIFGNDFQVPVGGQVYETGFQMSNTPPNGYTASESTFTEEFRLQGTAMQDRLSYQAGAYLESAQPISSLAGSQSPGFASCPGNNFSSGFNCSSPFAGLFGLPGGIGNVNYTVGQTAFHDVGLYGQATYKLTEQFKLTGGFRYTWDREKIDAVQRTYLLAAPPAGGIFPDFATGQPYTCLQQSFIATYPACETHFSTKSSAPTWLIDLDYNPSRNVLLYAKYSRGYRQAVIVPVIPVTGTAANPDFTINYPKPEKVDAYEVGAKTSWHGAISGSFNVAGFYNKFTNQQLQLGFIPSPGSNLPENSAPGNAGRSTIYGAEVEATLTPLQGLDFTLGYTYLHTRIDKVLALPSVPGYITEASFFAGDPLALSPKHKVAVGATYTLPLDESVGKLSIGGSLTYRSKMLSNYIDRANTTAPTIAPLSYLPSLTLVDANVNWKNVASTPIDLAFFVTNLTNKKYYAYIPGLGSSALGFEDGTVGEPRMFGGTVKYHF